MREVELGLESGWQRRLEEGKPAWSTPSTQCWEQTKAGRWHAVAATRQSLTGVAKSWKRCRKETGIQAGSRWASRRCTALFLAPQNTAPRLLQCPGSHSNRKPLEAGPRGRGRTPRAPCWTVLSRVSTRSLGPGFGGNPIGETSGRDVIPG